MSSSYDYEEEEEVEIYDPEDEVIDLSPREIEAVIAAVGAARGPSGAMRRANDFRPTEADDLIRKLRVYADGVSRG